MKKKLIISALLLLCICAVIPFTLADLPRNSSFWYGNDPVLLPHREDFSPEVPSQVYAAFGPGTDVLKVYPSLPRTMWFQMEDFEDFSQIVTAEPFYVVQSSESGYSSYAFAEDGSLTERGSASVTHSTQLYGLFGLSNDLIRQALKDIDYEDYIITDSAATIVWVRREAGDLFLTYPTRPDLMGIASGKLYTLDELKAALSAAYANE